MSPMLLSAGTARMRKGSAAKPPATTPTDPRKSAGAAPCLDATGVPARRMTVEGRERVTSSPALRPPRPEALVPHAPRVLTSRDARRERVPGPGPMGGRPRARPLDPAAGGVPVRAGAVRAGV